MSPKRPPRAAGAVTAALVFWMACSAAAGPLGDKAVKYEDQYQAFHSCGLGGALQVRFTDDSLTTPKRYIGMGDSTIHTGAYLAAESFRWAATHDPAALDNARRAARALHTNLKITGKSGYIARYAGKALWSLGYLPGTCRDDHDCHLVEGSTLAAMPWLSGAGLGNPECRVSSGDSVGRYFWLGDTSRDQYDGWFFGYGVAYQLIEDPALRAMISADVKEVIDELEATNWRIIDVDGAITGAGSVTFNPDFRMGWSAVAAEAIPDPAYRERYRYEADLLLSLAALSFLEVPSHHCSEYYAVMFFHRTGYDISRLDPSPTRRRLYGWDFKALVRPFTKGTDNVFFDYVYMVVSSDQNPAVMARDREALGLFPEPPNRDVCRNPPPAPECGMCRIMNALGRGEPSAARPYPIEQQCSTDFLWQRSPFVMHCCDYGNPAHVYPGVDYLLAYWMGRYHGFLSSSD